MRRFMPLAGATLLALVSIAARAETQITLHSVKVDLPDDSARFSGPGSEAANNDCLACHSADMVLNQPPMAPPAWFGVVRKMARVYKAPVDEDDAAAVLDYLTRTRAAK